MLYLGSVMAYIIERANSVLIEAILAKFVLSMQGAALALDNIVMPKNVREPALAL
jgi:hypothetical protein